ncbi:Glycerol-3-phosphate regulon repressor, DeoR family [Roseibacterium elongatum DSM 19469]|uniref:Glycerol-3-phosphate regulon repressor, DeoR family n=1 Tax=Roseicyclus elongatus DSM 19469 TaxID=1294273 RepID=W8SKG5_9RHOB|nr:DeoR/GlpR family DNA-binding transcription regulator [Roseibacterium elongatum]AHM03000.1 Glycerol-3-phosphate regulon repressor, DeoR family [Roseibacterium elongatum DSM 19469]
MPISIRQDDILRAARESGRVNVEDLATRFEVTVQTIRRDLTDLCEAGLLDRVHGGAVLPSGITNIGYEERRRTAAGAKDAIGRTAAALIPPGACVFLNIGTTTEAVARALRDVSNLLVVTNNLNVAHILSGHPSAEVIVSGGRLRRADNGLVGERATATINQFKADLAVLGCSGVDLDGELLDFDPEEVRVSRAFLSKARSTILVADDSKLARNAPVRIANLANLDRWVTNAEPPDALLERCLENETEITIAG